MSGFEPFSKDVKQNGHYIYTGSQSRKSAKVANLRQSELIHEELIALNIRSVIDIGCGDGTYTYEFSNLGFDEIVGLDPSKDAIEFAEKNFSTENNQITFVNGTLENFEYTKKFDCAVFRGVLHHCEDPVGEIRKASQIAKNIIISEPNGLNALLKIIEKSSKYHREHGERSFSKFKIKKWIEANDCKVIRIRYGVTVPFFFPDKLVDFLDSLDQVIRKIPIARTLLLGTQVFTSSKIDSL